MVNYYWFNLTSTSYYVFLARGDSFDGKLLLVMSLHKQIRIGIFPLPIETGILEMLR